MIVPMLPRRILDAQAAIGLHALNHALELLLAQDIVVGGLLPFPEQISGIGRKKQLAGSRIEQLRQQLLEKAQELLQAQFHVVFFVGAEGERSGTSASASSTFM